MYNTTQLSHNRRSALLNNDPTPSHQTPATVQPNYQVKEQDDQFVIELFLPNVAKSNVKMSFKGNILTVTAHRTAPPSTWTTLYRETRAGDFHLTLEFAAEVAPEGAQAALVDGLLTVTLPKAAGARRHDIAIH